MTQAPHSLTELELQRLAAALARREDDLRTQIAERRAALERPTPASEPPGDDADLAFARTRAGIDRELIDRYLLEIAEIGEARARLAEGSFGICPDCGSAIGWERLRASPAARRCADCQALYERQAPRALHALGHR
jgi:RNA polymerase-binding transcription factor DksA